MLYKLFLVSTMFASAMGILYMVCIDDFTSLFLPLSSLIGGSHYFLKDNECEYEVRHTNTSKRANNKKNFFSLEEDNAPYFNDYTTPTVYHNSGKNNTARGTYVSQVNSNIYKEIITNKKQSANITLAD